MKFGQLISSISQTHSAFQNAAVKSVNQMLTLRNWVVGYYIVEFEQNGEDRAAYGDRLIKNLAAELKQIRGFSERNLYLCKQFYIIYPQVGTYLRAILGEMPILQLPTAISGMEEKLQLPTAKSENDLALPIEEIVTKISFTHLAELMNLQDPLKRTFYELETIKGNWNVKELKRQINSLFFERTGLSRNPKALVEKVRKMTSPSTPTDIIKNVYAFEFLEFPEKGLIEENDLETALLDHIQEFILELGHGFCFEARQKRILIGDEYFWIDLVFYHRILKCHVLIDLKVEKFSHANAGQLNTYLNYYKSEVMQPNDNPPVGILLVTNKNDALVKFATAGMDQNLFVQKYLLELPSKEQLEEHIRKELKSRY